MHGRSRRFLTLVAAALASVTALAACGSSSKSSAPPTTVSATTVPFKAAAGPLGTGVTAKTIKVGVAVINFAPIEQYTGGTHGDEQAISQVMINYFNTHGGFGGRTLDASYDLYIPIPGTGLPVGVCTHFTEDVKVYAILGNIEDSTGAAQACVSKKHATVFMGHDLTDAELADVALPGLMTTTDVAAERRLKELLYLLDQNKTLQGKKVAVLAEPATQSRISSIIDPAFKQMGVATGTPGVLQTGVTTDTTAALAQLDSIIEKWKTEGVNAVLISGADVVSSQFVDKLTAAMPGVMLMTDAESSAASQAQHAVSTKQNPNSYENMLTANGLSDQDQFMTPTVQNCVKIYESATGQKVIAPDDLKPDASGNRIQVYTAITDICRQLTLFKQITDKIGPYLNNTNWSAAVASLGTVKNLPGSQFASMHVGKYDVDDTYGLAKFISAKNDFVVQGQVLNAADNPATS